MPEEIIYTSGASESNNLAIKGIVKAYKHVGKHILSTCLEHPSVSGTLAALQDDGYEIELVKILKNGQIDLMGLKKVLRKDTVLLCISSVDSELGVIQNIDEIINILAGFPHCHLHVDGAQAVGKIPLSLEGVSTFSLSAHKFYGLTGLGILVKKNNVVLEPIIHGGKSTTIYRSGTPTVALAAAALKALELSTTEMDTRLNRVIGLRQYMLEELKKHPKVRVNSPQEWVSPYILNLGIDNIKATDFQQYLSKNKILISTKSACSANNAPSRPVMAVTHDKRAALSSCRISFSHLTTLDNLDKFFEIMKSVIVGV